MLADPRRQEAEEIARQIPGYQRLSAKQKEAYIQMLMVSPSEQEQPEEIINDYDRVQARRPNDEDGAPQTFQSTKNAKHNYQQELLDEQRRQ